MSTESELVAMRADVNALLAAVNVKASFLYTVSDQAAAVATNKASVDASLTTIAAAAATTAANASNALVASQSSGVTLHYDTMALATAGLAAATANAVARVWSDETRGGLSVILRKESNAWVFKRYEPMYLVGTAPDQVPLNLHLGSMAFQDGSWIPFEIAATGGHTTAIANAGRANVDYAVPGCLTTDGVDYISLSITVPAGITWTTNINADGWMSVCYMNNTGASWTPGAHTIRGRVCKWLPD